MNNDLNIALSISKQSYDELIELISIADIGLANFGIGPKRDRVESLLQILYSKINRIEIELSKQVSESTDSPILEVPQALRTFYIDVLEKQTAILKKAFLRISGLEDMYEFFQQYEHGKKINSNRRNAIHHALERWMVTLDEDVDLDDWSNRGFDISGAQELMESPWFQPDQWQHNLELLKPILIDRNPKSVQTNARIRLSEIYQAFMFDLWMAVLALSRSLVEFSILKNAKKFGIEAEYKVKDGKSKFKTLETLCEELGEQEPSLISFLRYVRTSGNQIMHPRKNDNVVAFQSVRRDEALECIKATKIIVEVLYSDLHNLKQND